MAALLVENKIFERINIKSTKLDVAVLMPVGSETPQKFGITRPALFATSELGFEFHIKY